MFNVTNVKCQQRMVTIMLGLLFLSKLVHYMFNVTNVRCQQRMVTIMLGLLVLSKLVHYMFNVTCVTGLDIKRLYSMTLGTSTFEKLPARIL